METIFGVSQQALMGQLLVGMINGSFYALLSLGLAIIFGLLNIINFAHGAQYMMSAFVAWLLLDKLGIGYWWALLLAPVMVGAIGLAMERLLLKRLYHLDHLYGLLLTFGIALIIQGVFLNLYGSTGLRYEAPAALSGGMRLSFMFLPYYRAWVVLASVLCCLATWLVIEKTKLGAYLRAGTENPALVRAFGVNVPRMITLTYGFGVALAGFAGVMAAPIYQVNPLMGADLIVVVFAVVVIGGMGSILGSIVTGFGLGIIEGLTKVFYPEASNTVIFIVMALVLIVRPAGLFGSVLNRPQTMEVGAAVRATSLRFHRLAFVVLAAVFALAPLVMYPVFLMKVMCFALFAAAFNLLVGYVGLLSFGQAMFLATGGYIAAHSAKVWGWNPEWSILAGTATATVLGGLAGLIAIRRQGIYFAMITLALSQMVYFFYLQAPFTHGEDGIQAVPQGLLFGFIDLGNVWALYAFVFVLCGAGLLLIYRVVNSPFGEVLRAIRDNEPRAISLGYRTHVYKLLAFVLAAGLAGLAGSLKVFVFQLASLADAHWSLSGEVVLMTLLGGMGTLFGPVAGAFLLVSLENYLATMGAWITIVQGVIYVLCVLSFRRGLMGELGRLLKRPL
jgi:branched-chain amino acid transport system permease protein